MDTTLEKIQKVSHVAKVLCKIVCIASVIGAVVSGIAVMLYASGVEDFLDFMSKAMPVKAFTYLDNHVDELISSGETDIAGLAAGKLDLSKTQISCIALMGIVALINSAIISIRAAKYFDNELKAGTPFTLDVADDMKKLGLFMIIVSCIASVVNGIIYFAGKLPDDVSSSVSSIDSGISIGILALIASLVLRYGAELLEKKS